MIKYLNNKFPQEAHRKSIWLYNLILAFTALGAGLSDQVFSNYFKDAYNVTAFQRGLIEFPRELPGLLAVFLITMLSSLGSTRISMIAQVLIIAGLAALGVLTPPFAVMLVFIFINSIGLHLWFPLQDTIAMRLINDEQNAGRTVGNFKGISTAFSMVAAIIVFLGFRFRVFSLTTPIKWVFLIGVGFYLVVLFLLFFLRRSMAGINKPDAVRSAAAANTAPDAQVRKFSFVFRKEYKYYYILATVFGVQKQIMFVYGPWVLIELLDKKADTLALLGMIGAFAGIFFIPALGRWLDRFGIKKMLYADALSFIGVYLCYGLFSAGFSSGFLPKAGIPMIMTFALFVIDRMSMQMGLIRALYLRSIVVKQSDIAPTLTLGQGMDHIVSILCATLGGLLWSTWGPQYIFFLAAGLSLINLFVAIRVKISPSEVIK